MALYQTGTGLSALVGIGTTNPTSNLQVVGNVLSGNVISTVALYGVLAGANTIAGSSLTLTSALAVAYGGTGTTTSTGSGSVVLSAGPSLTGTTSIATLNLTNALGVLYGGTGSTTAQSAINTLAGSTTSAQYLRGNGTNVVMSAIQASDVPTLNQSTTGSAGSLSTTYGTGQILYGQASGVPASTSTFVYSGGNVGIGTANPLNQFIIYNTTARTDTITTTLPTSFTPDAVILRRHGPQNGYTYPGPALAFRVFNGTNIWDVGTIMGAVDGLGGTNTSGGLFFYTGIGGQPGGYTDGRNAGGVQTLALALGYDQRAYFAGNVGIGTTNPQSALHVNSTGIGIVSTGTVWGHRIVYGNYGVSSYQDGSNFYYLITNSGDQYGSYNSLRPFYFNLSSGYVNMNNGLAVYSGLTADQLIVYSSQGTNRLANLNNTYNAGGSNQTVFIHTDQPFSVGTTAYTGAALMCTTYPNGAAGNQGYTAYFGTSDGAANSLAPQLVIKSNGGSVGIGTTNPGAALDVWNGAIRCYNNVNGSPSIIQSYNASSGSSAYAIYYLSTDANSCIWFKNSSTRTADGGANNATLRNDGGALRLCGQGDSPNIYLDPVGQAVVIGRNATSYNSPCCLHLAKNTGVTTQLIWECSGYATAGISLSTSTFTMGAENKDITFRTGCAYNGDFTSTGTERMRITQGGNVGIGTTNPNAPLNVWGSGPYSGLTANPQPGQLILNTTTGTERLILGSWYTAGTGSICSIQASDYYSSVDHGQGLVLNPLGGNVGIGTTNPGYTLDVGGSFRTTGSVVSTASYNSSFIIGASGGGNNGQTGVLQVVGIASAVLAIGTSMNSTGDQVHLQFNNPNGVCGSIHTNGSGSSYVTSSDYRLKSNVVPMTDGLNVVSRLSPVYFTFNADPDKVCGGFIAHVLQGVVPDAVTGSKDEVNEDGTIKPQGVDSSFLVSYLVSAVQQLSARVADLEKKAGA